MADRVASVEIIEPVKPRNIGCVAQILDQFKPAAHRQDLDAFDFFDVRRHVGGVAFMTDDVAQRVFDRCLFRLHLGLVFFEDRIDLGDPVLDDLMDAASPIPCLRLRPLSPA